MLSLLWINYVALASTGNLQNICLSLKKKQKKGTTAYKEVIIYNLKYIVLFIFVVTEVLQ